jgi:ribose 5-phosphate isomerase B
MKVVFASDHAGFELKNELITFVREELQYEIDDCGPYTYDADDDYVDYVKVAAQKVSDDPEHVRGIILGGSGQGEAMCANRFAHVRATAYYHHDLDIIRLSREHNNANVLSLGARFLTKEEAVEAVRTWLLTPYTYETRHARRIEKLG